MVVFSEAYLPAVLTVPRMTDELFAQFSEQYDQCRLEYFDGELHLRPFADPETGARGARVLAQVAGWWRSFGSGYVTESRCGYILRDGSRLYPNVAWTPSSDSDAKFIVDILSPRDHVAVAHAKMQLWLAKGAELGWMIDPQRRAVTVYRPGQEPETIEPAESIRGEGPVEGLVVDLKRVWEI